MCLSEARRVSAAPGRYEYHADSRALASFLVFMLVANGCVGDDGAVVRLHADVFTEHYASI